MNLRLFLCSTACMSYFMIPATATSLLAAAAAVKGAIIGAGLTGAALSSSSGDETVIIQPGSIAVEAGPPQVQQVIVQQPVEYKPIQTVSLIPVATIPSSNSITDKISTLWGSISNAINSKARAVGDFLRSFRAPPRIILININTTSTTTTTTKKPKTTTHKPVVIEIVAGPQQRFYPLGVPVLEDYDKK